ncbi:MAG: hypothetical protein IT340_21605 [Chloroflexi bacterium]|nr:hypothetical protein [Chloroflexota bacterium]
MDGGDVLQQIGLVLAGLVAVMVLAAIVGRVVGRLCRLVGLPAGLGGVMGALFPFAVLIAGSLYLDQAGVVVPAQVQSKEERISSARGRAPDNWWTRQLTLTVAFTTVDGRPTTTQLFTDEEGFDALRPGAAVQVRYLPELRVIARPADQSTLSLVPWSWLPTIGLALASIALIWLMIRRRAPKPLTAIAVGVGIFGLLTWLFPPWEPEPTGPLQTATAEVRNVRSITRSVFSGRTRWDAPQPWELVELTFVPAGRDQPVVAVDGVDRGSVAGLTAGARLSVTYPAAAPRSARLVGAARTYRWQEWLGLAETVLLIGAVLGGLWLLGKLWGRLWHRATARRPDDAA